MRLRGALALAASVAAVWAGLPPLTAAAEPAAGSIGIRLVDAPVSAAHDSRARIYIVDQLRPGTTISRRVRLTNSSDQPLNVATYAAAASISTGKFRFAVGRTANSLTSWTTVSPSTVTLAARASADVTVRIVVPKDAAGGEQYAVIWAQISSSEVPVGGLLLVNRVGVRMYLDVSGNRQASSFTITGITASRDQARRPQITARVRNTGQRAIDVAGTIGLSNGPGGVNTTPVRTNATVTIAPGDEQTVTASFDPRLQPGPWLATVKLASGSVQNTAAATVNFGAASTVLATGPVHRPDSSWSWWMIVALIGLVALLALAILAWYARRARSDDQPATVA